MSLLSMSLQVLDLVGWDALTSIASNSDKTARQIKAIANQELRNVSKRFDWRHLLVEYEINTVSGKANYDLPEDFDKLMQDSVYNTDEYYRLRSSMSDHQWNGWRHGLVGSISHARFRVMPSADGAVFTISPTPNETETLVLLYKSKYHALDNATPKNPKVEFDQDTDIARIPEDVVFAGMLWRFRHAKGLDYSAELAEYNEICRTRYAQTLGEGDLPVPNSVLEPEITSGFVPDSGFG